jgi:hypothetical protein
VVPSIRHYLVEIRPNPMPESVTDRPTKAHEYVFLLSKTPRYFFDQDAVREPHTAPPQQYLSNGITDARAAALDAVPGNRNSGFMKQKYSGGPQGNPAGRNKRSVWTVATQAFPGAHFATFPPKLIEPCILAGSSPKACGVCGAPWRRVVERTPMVVEPSERRNGWQEDQPDLSRTQTGGTMTQAPSSRTVGWEPSCQRRCSECRGAGYYTTRWSKQDRPCGCCGGSGDDDTGRSVVLDPFAGAGTTGVVSRMHDRRFIGIELNPAYAEMARERIRIAEPQGWQEALDMGL